MSARLLVAFMLLGALVPRQAAGQVGVSGSIVGQVRDGAGHPIMGVRIVASSPTEIGGPKTTWTNEAGRFRLVGLAPGTFQVTASAAKLKSVIRKEVRVGVTAAAEVNVQMEPESSIEQVVVEERLPIVSTTSATVKEVYDEEFVDRLPLDHRSAFESFIGYNTPGAYFNGVRFVRVRGGASEQNAFNVEGFTVNGHKIALRSLAALEVQTAAYGAEHANVPGGVVNMVTKTGSNRFELDVSAFHEDTALTFFTDPTDAEARSRAIFANPAVSGPILKDRLWFYANVEMRANATARDGDDTDVLGPPPTTSLLEGRGSLKVTWQVSPRHKLTSFSHVNRDGSKNDAFPLPVERDAQVMRDHNDYLQGVIWEALLSDNLFLRTQAGLQRFWEREAPELCRDEPIRCQHIAQVRQTFPKPLRLGNHDLHQEITRRTFELTSQLEWFRGTRGFGEHQVRLRSRIFHQLYDRMQSTPGDAWVQVAGDMPLLQRRYFSNDPRFEPARFGSRIQSTTGLVTVHSLSDSARVTPFVTVQPGLALTTVRASVAGDAALLSHVAVTPHLAAVWDATHDGRTALRASFGQYVDSDSVRLARFAVSERVYQECRYNQVTDAYDLGCVWGGGPETRTFGSPCGPDGLDAEGKSCREALRIPRTWEYTLGMERDVRSGLAVGLDVVYRRYAHPYEIRETNRIWNAAGTGLEPEASYRNGRAEMVNDLGTPEKAERRYLGATLGVHKREGKLRLDGSYTWSHLEGNVNNNETNDFGSNPARDAAYGWGDLPDDVRHSLRVATTYQPRAWLSAGVLWRYSSGRPYSRFFRNDVLFTNTDLRAQVGVDPGVNINDPGDDRALRYPDLLDVHLQMRANLQPLVRQRLELYVDILNVLALRSTTTVDTNDGPGFGTPRGRLSPLRLRLGLRYRY